MSLTNRELEVLGFVAEGKTQALIAKMLSVSYETINHHIDNAKTKLNAKNTTNAVAIALRNKIIS